MMDMEIQQNIFVWWGVYVYISFFCSFFSFSVYGVNHKTTMKQWCHLIEQWQWGRHCCHPRYGSPLTCAWDCCRCCYCCWGSCSHCTYCMSLVPMFRLCKQIRCPPPPSFSTSYFCHKSDGAASPCQ